MNFLVKKIKTCSEYHVLITFLFVALIGTTYYGCSAKSASALIMTDAEEERLGKQFHLQLLDSSNVYPIYVPETLADTQFVEYVTGIFNEVLSSVPKDDKVDYNNGFTFNIIDKNVENAFAVPGGYIYIYTGIIKNMENEAELAGVLGHEIAHVTQHHYRRSVAKTAIASTLIDALVGDESTLAVFVKGSFNVLAGSYMSRDHESESDEFGTIYLANTNRNPRGIASFFSGKEGSVLKWLSSHPDSEDRVEAVNEQVDLKSAWESIDTEENKYVTRFMESTSVIR